ncbi:uncharacterized protein LOC115110684 [Oncorhynchus nerka]|uniref:uncharacterized protein LOC115110684 n=1 Tax=Oncorhynchus nerka TaxID=8023 RepID=UPI0031B82977
MADYSYLAMSRSCGGSHTVTYPNRRYTRLQHFSHFIQAEEETPPISSSPLRIQFQKPGCVTPVRPQSAKTQRSRSASGSSVRDRPHVFFRLPVPGYPSPELVPC